ncbi:hypothetical protein L1887_16481 [Cichorium endivia]|nr:hypothetical protein L1887_16481 [Cichorium endivia]
MLQIKNIQRTQYKNNRNSDILAGKGLSPDPDLAAINSSGVGVSGGSKSNSSSSSIFVYPSSLPFQKINTSNFHLLRSIHFEIMATTTARPQRSPEEIEDIILRKIFLVTLIDSMGNDTRVVYLEMTADEILSEGGELRLSRDLMERVLVYRLSRNFTFAEPPFNQCFWW